MSDAFNLAGGCNCSTEPGSASAAGRSRSSSSWHSAQPAQVALERLPLELGERAEQVGADVVPIARVIGHAMPPTISRLIFSSPSRIRPFTVPIGSSSSSAIWVWREAAEVRQLDRLPLLDRQRLQCSAHVARLLPPDHLDVRPLARLEALLHPVERLAPAVVDRAAPQRVDPAVVDDAQHPGAHAAARLVVAQAAAPDREKRLLHHVLRLAPASPPSGRRARTPRRRGGRRAARTRAGRPSWTSCMTSSSARSRMSCAIPCFPTHVRTIWMIRPARQVRIR